MTEAHRGKVVQLRPPRAALHAQIRDIAHADQRVFFGRHARERMVERSITRLDAIRVLRIGHIEGEIEAGSNPGEWKCKVTANVKGSREIGVVTIVAHGNTIFVKTVEWEDL